MVPNIVGLTRSIAISLVRIAGFFFALGWMAAGLFYACFLVMSLFGLGMDRDWSWSELPGLVAQLDLALAIVYGSGWLAVRIFDPSWLDPKSRLKAPLWDREIDGG